MKLDSTPAYIRIYESYRREILFGRIKCGFVLPPLSVEAQRFSVSTSTVHRAYKMLCEQGFAAKQGRGYRVVFSGQPQ
jgi:DNA-binding GntR family transcriptional regulator